MEHSALLELLAHELTAAFGARFATNEYSVDSIAFYGERTLKQFDIGADPGAIIRDVMQALVAMKARGQLRFHNDDFPIQSSEQVKILNLPPCVILIGSDSPGTREKITFQFDVEVTAGQTRIAP